MARFCLFLLIVFLAAPVLAQEPVEEPPEEDVDPREKPEYVLNPLQALKEIRVGNYYFKKGSYKASARRYEEAVKWDPNFAEAWYKLGESQAKLRNDRALREAWTKYLELEPDGKYASNVKKHLNRKP